jgi:hypothetical protein
MAIEYYAAAIVVDDALGKGPGAEITAPHSVNFLIGRSIELAIKSFLAHRGTSLDIIKRIGHDLEAALMQAERHGLESMTSLTDDDRGILSVLNALYCSKQFEYPVNGAKCYPVFGPLDLMALRILRPIIDTIPHASSFLARKPAGRILAEHAEAIGIQKVEPRTNQS